MSNCGKLDKKITIYEPNEKRGGLIWGLKQGWYDLWIARHVVFQLFKRDFVVQFRQTLFGYLWAILTPLFGIFSFLYLYFIGVLDPGVQEMPYPLYVLIGSNIWAILTGTMNAVSGGLRTHADLIMRTNIPKFSLAVSSLANVIYSIFISMITTGLIFLFYGLWPTLWFLLYPLLVTPLILIGVALGLVLAVIGSIARDITNIFSQAISMLLFFTPVIYLSNSITNPLIYKIVVYNPFTYMIDVPRSLIYYGNASNIPLYLFICISFLFIFIIGIRIFYLIDDLVAERL